jgi:hypothetical protein
MKNTAFLLFILCAIPTSYSQTASSDVISTSGSSIVAEGLVMSWTIGENIIDFYQDYSMVTGNSRSDLYMKDGTLITVYPTLTKEFVFIRIEADNHPVLKAELTDMKGNVLITVTLDAGEVEMNIGDFMYGTYILRISDPDFNNCEIVKSIKQ